MKVNFENHFCTGRIQFAKWETIEFLIVYNALFTYVLCIRIPRRNEFVAVKREPFAFFKIDWIFLHLLILDLTIDFGTKEMTKFSKDAESK
jgi:hypothetical protein